MELLSRLLNPILGFLVTVAFGFWLSRVGKPYNGLLFNIHKLVALASVILAGLAVYQVLKVMDVATLIFLLLVLAALSVIALFVSGALMSAGKGEYSVMKLVHNISPFILVIAMGATVYLLRSM
jgi:hypothetical protein